MTKSFLFVIPIFSAIPFWVTGKFFDTPQLHVFFSADIFFLLLLFLLPYGKILYKIPFVLACCIYAFISDSIDVYITMGVYVLMIFVTTATPRVRKFVLPVYSLFALLFLIADAGNFFYSTFVLTLPDVWGLAKFYWWGIFLFFLIPLSLISLQILFAQRLLWGKEHFEISHLAVLCIIASMVAANAGVNKLQRRQPIMDFATQKWFWQLCTPGIIGQNPYLQEDIKAAFPFWQKGKTVVGDCSKSTVVVLVESYGVNKSVAYTKALLSPFSNSNAQFLGLYPRDASHTQGAEWEDFDALGGTIRQTPLPQKFKENNFQTWYLHGYDEKFYERGENYGKFGFDSLLFKKDLASRGLASCHYGFDGICDTSIVNYIDSLLTDSIPKFIYWTTLDAHPPYELADGVEKSSVCRSMRFDDVDCVYFTLQQNTMKRLAKQAEKHPDYRFIIRGDHRPMGSLEQSSFVQSFYFRWVPLVILN
ncbi:sulfatase-like hydrolase/transferase [Fibrobacter sp.]|uniref:sulfatase-like hydrolase/transferase n=1 Tax=Fibrobacter sp. TaxID=35828 RepID=UPI0025BE3C91|nr:sulfatase-like hydrolase/transferase [Fibrobacter sp.]MBR3072904.1 sulfatase-like hydrolase/transferase [Fibrobacter sp.]